MFYFFSNNSKKSCNTGETLSPRQAGFDQGREILQFTLIDLAPRTLQVRRGSWHKRDSHDSRQQADDSLHPDSFLA